jgi:hypothetical protein
MRVRWRRQKTALASIHRFHCGNLAPKRRENGLHTSEFAAEDRSCAVAFRLGLNVDTVAPVKKVSLTDAYSLRLAKRQG